MTKIPRITLHPYVYVNSSKGQPQTAEDKYPRFCLFWSPAEDTGKSALILNFTIHSAETSFTIN